MEDFIAYLTQQLEAGKSDIARLDADGLQDDADFAKVRTNIYEIARTVTMALRNRPGAGTEAVEAQFARFRAGWQATLDKAREHGDTRNIVVEETKLSALEDIIAHFREVEK